MASNPDERLVSRYKVFQRLGAARSGKLPVIQQLTPTDCGAACLAMVLEHHGKRLPMDEIR